MLLILGAVAGGAVPVHQQSCVAQGIANSKKGVVCPRTQPCRSCPQEVLNHSDHHPVLFLSNLVEGTYTFHLKVTDAKGESDTDRTTVEVKPGELSLPGRHPAPERADLLRAIQQLCQTELVPQHLLFCTWPRRAAQGSTGV